MLHTDVHYVNLTEVSPFEFRAAVQERFPKNARTLDAIASKRTCIEATVLELKLAFGPRSTHSKKLAPKMKLFNDIIEYFLNRVSIISNTWQRSKQSNEVTEFLIQSLKCPEKF